MQESPLRDAPTLIAVTLGDPNGVGPEVALKALARSRTRGIRWVVIGDPAVFRAARARFAPGIRFAEATPEALAGDPKPGAGHLFLPLRAVGLKPGRTRSPTAAGGRAAFGAVVAGIDLCREGAARALVTAPISKEALRAAGHPYPGHTEILAAHCPGTRPVMAFFGGPIRVALATVHVPLARVPELLTRESIVRAGRALAGALRRHFNVRRPRVAVAGLNPHAGEGGLFGREEIRTVAPAVRALQAGGVAASGPWPPDTVFRRARRGEFDGVVALYHDQGLIPVKLISFERAVNVTLGLPFVRTSPDHGTAYDIAWKGRADPRSMAAALALAVRMARE